ncbi:MAG: hypothetical protein LBD88_04990 [Candidatus Peribacteria bacterium]|nr:hypothetical protein [Candidatus Peribacteria bacterium]
MSSGIIISSFEIERPEIVEYLYQKFFILSTNLAVSSEPSSSKDFVSNFLITHFLKVSFINPSFFGTISLKSNLQ